MSIKLPWQGFLACCLLLSAFCMLAFAQGGTGKLPPMRNPPQRNPPIRNPPPRNPPPRTPDLKISERRVKDIVVLDLNGKITAREGGPMLRERIRRLLRDGKKKILLNLAKVSSMDAVEAKEMLSSYFSVEKDGGQLRLCSPTRNVRELLERPSGSEALSAARHVVFMARVFEKEEEALSSFE